MTTTEPPEIQPPRPEEQTEPVALVPAGRLAPVARQLARTAKTAGVVLALATVAIVVGGISAGLVLVPLIWLVMLGPLALAFIRRGRRAAAVAQLADRSTGHSFMLTGQALDVWDDQGLVQPQLSLRVGRRHLRELRDAPQAILRPR